MAIAEPEQFIWLARALGEIKGAEAVSALTPWLSDDREAMRDNAVHALGEIGDPSVIPLFERILEKDASQRVRTQTVLALGKIHSKEIVPILVEALRDPGRLIQRTAHGTLQEVTGRDFPIDYTAWRMWWDKVNAAGSYDEAFKGGRLGREKEEKVEKAEKSAPKPKEEKMTE
jgi:hypothetical protein